MSSKHQQQQQDTTTAQRGPMPPTKRTRRDRDDSVPSPQQQFQDQDADADAVDQAAATATSNPGSNSAGSVDAILRNISASGEEIPPSKYAKVAESKHIIYDLDEFDPRNVVWSSKVYKNQQGEMYYVNYKYPDGITGPLLVNTCCMRSAKGYQSIVDQKTNKVSHLVFGSLENDEKSNAFKNMLARYDECTKHMIIEKEWCSTKKNPSLEEITTALQPCIMQGMSEQGVLFPPSFKMQVSVNDPRNHTSFFLEPSFITVPPERLQSNSFFTAVVQLRWVFRKKQGDRKAYPLGFSFSNNICMTQVVIHEDEAGDNDICHVRLPAKSLATAVVADAGVAPPQPTYDAPIAPPPQKSQIVADIATNGEGGGDGGGDDTVAAFAALPSPSLQNHTADLP